MKHQSKDILKATILGVKREKQMKQKILHLLDRLILWFLYDLMGTGLVF